MDKSDCSITILTHDDTHFDSLGWDEDGPTITGGTFGDRIGQPLDGMTLVVRRGNTEIEITMTASDARWLCDMLKVRLDGLDEDRKEATETN